MVDYKKEFIDKLHKLSRSEKGVYEVWKDIIVLFAIEISNTSMRPYKDTEIFRDIWKEREERYITIMKKYSKDQQKEIVDMFCLLVMEYEREPYQDLLGSLFMTLNLFGNKKGQFFTPYDLCKLMSNLTINDRKSFGKQVHKQGFIRIADEACGAGATLIAAIEKIAKDIFKKFNWQNHVYFVGQDIEEQVALMCYIQISLLGAAGHVAIGNTLTENFVTDLSRIYITPMSFTDVWVQRRFFGGYDLLMNRG